ncbi:hypothetical protein [Capillimicrobium parvum]|uniref:Uncharacterized protein n=1 Tax=Capillimicrobium parvum TaxID=2884022 RepID=A0A9E6XW07_9ACTN|nr:hypothetical protein [Capillimicrobium parvum]UGS35463.1 hypothetical protein DSM104329_01851 [Capillimicrobium parvum]
MESPLSDQSSAARSPVLAPRRIHEHARVFMPQPEEPVHAYAARLRAMHNHLGMLIEAVERGMGDRPPLRTVKRERPAEPPPLTSLIVVAPPAASLGPRPRLPVAPVVAPAVAPAPSAAPPIVPRPYDPAVDPDRRAGGPDRRRGVRDRRGGPADRRRGGPDLRAAPVERRAGPADRRSGRRDRRLGHARRTVDRRPAQIPEPRLDGVTAFWIVNIAVWLGIFVFVMIWAT